MNVASHFLRRLTRPLVGCQWVGYCLAASTIGAQILIPEWALAPSYGDEHPDHLVITYGLVSVDGDVARFQERTGLSQKAFGGIAELSVFRELGENADRMFKLDLRAMPGLEELALGISYEKVDQWRVSFSFDKARSYFDPEGGAAFDRIGSLDLEPDALNLDFGVIRFEVERSFEDLPTVRLRYTRRFREGERDSTIWGQVGSARVGASIREVNESSDLVDLEIEDRNDIRRWKVAGHYEHTESESTLHAINDSGINPAEPIEHREETTSDRVSANAYVVQQISEDATISLGGMVSQLDGNVSGSRLVSNGSAFINLTGQSDLYQYVVNGNFSYRWNASVDSVVAMSVRGEELKAGTSKNHGTGPDVVDTIDQKDCVDLIFETRFRTSKRVSFYFLAKRSDGDGVLSEEGDRISRTTDSEDSAVRYAVGFRLNPAPRTSLSGEYFHQVKDTQFTHQRTDALSWAYPGHIESLEQEVNDLNLRFTIRPHSTLYLVSRADLLHRTIRPNFGLASMATETDVDHFTLSQNVSFTPKQGWVIQAMASWTENLHRTPLSSSDSELAQILPDSINDHWSLQLGFYGALNEKTDLQATYTYFRANNFSDNSDLAVPFEAAEEEHQLNVVLSRQLSERVRGLIRYGYFEGRDLGPSDLNDYQAHVVYSSILYRF